MEDSLKEPQQLNMIMKGLNKQAKTRTRLPINPTLLQSLVHTGTHSLTYEGHRKTR